MDARQLRDLIAEGIPTELTDSPHVGIGGARRLKIADAVLAGLRDNGLTVVNAGDLKADLGADCGVPDCSRAICRRRRRLRAALPIEGTDDDTR